MPDLATGKGTRVGVLLVPLVVVLFISNLDQTIVATALPSIARDLGDVGGSSWIATAYLLTSAVTTLPVDGVARGGAVADRAAGPGRRRDRVLRPGFAAGRAERRTDRFRPPVKG
ncbi:hypothetical protein [Amycolatopsis sp. cmx-8-4]|uniref:hypothetical protein n=1 Tax=Amycolatopsis sp. cmx-8-4 TaxID=2790947 RepID=UPI00397E595F